MPKRSGFDVQGMRFDVSKVQHITEPQEWRAIHQLVRGAFERALPAEHQRANGVDYIVPRSLDAFRENRRHPQYAFPGQSFHLKRTVRAFDVHANGKETLVGYLGYADNTSGSSIERLAKMWTPPQVNLPEFLPSAVRQFAHKRYVHMREIAVHPAAQHRGIAHVMTWLALLGKPDQQPVTAYSWKSELPQMASLFEAGGMYVFGIESDAIYGPTQPAVDSQRWVGHVGEINNAIEALPGARDALGIALETVQ